MRTAAQTIDGQVHGPAWLSARFGFSHVLGRMDGAGFFAYNMWHHQEAAHFEDVDIDAHSGEYLQCAGSAKAMTVELRQESADGHDHWVLATGPITGEMHHTVTWDVEFFAQVHVEEVFTSEQAAPLFEEYYLTGTIPDSVPRRRL